MNSLQLIIHQICVVICNYCSYTNAELGQGDEMVYCKGVWECVRISV